MVVDSSISNHEANAEFDSSQLDSLSEDIKSIESEDDLISKMLSLSSELVTITKELHRKNIALKKANEIITKLMHTDHLTGLANRRFFIEMLIKFLSYSKRHKTPLSIAMADLDQFKTINDTFGHDAGDQVLVAFATMLKGHSRTEDIQARFGGEEFMVLLPNTAKQGAITFIERVCGATRKLELPGIDMQISASFGVTQMVAEDTIKSIIKRVDEALYKSKRNGGNRITAE